MRRHASWRPRPLQRVTDLEPSDVARQLTVGEYKVFARCRSTDLLKQTNPKMAMSGDVLRVKALSERSNGIVAWIAATVLAEAEVKRRAELLRFFIKVAQTLRGLNNFNTLQSVLAGLDAVAIHRLRRSWDAVPSRTLATWTALKEGMSPARNFAAYRDAFEAAATPRIPFMGRTLTDLRFAEDGNPNFLDAERTVINFSKRMLQASILSRVEQSRIAYAIDVNPTVQQWLSTQCETAHRTWDSQTQYDVSCRLEPRESHPTPASLATSGVSRATTTAGSASSPPGQPSVRASS
ncbi:hypothetical protein CXG81DRAFT_10038 [Caulochytrium protostelioides]|uniref:Ras-GEF domain-containing protein n=1 Tax=Caulochytrium protostelioides TaxID=1555241 RepID=A0A4P9XD01_9FUNG|nr:hypothetical protein CXG81DRAFT_10038 [Caulochytrium protostelioides]|eukprot:RKP03050.1 hypothetical protein CXG81DRAFT_10038 [Caulochytrium protostelioides]